MKKINCVGGQAQVVQKLYKKCQLRWHGCTRSDDNHFQIRGGGDDSVLWLSVAQQKWYVRFENK
jgi:hypothetical protein